MLTAADSAHYDGFGARVAPDGTSALIGPTGHGRSQGVAYVFVHGATGWAQQAELSAADGAPGADFGESVVLAGPTALIGAWGKNEETGRSMSSRARARTGASKPS